MSEAGREVSLEFMYKFCTSCRFALGECLAIPELKQRLSELFHSGTLLNEHIFLEVLKDIYNQKYSHKKENREFCYTSARRVIRELEKLSAE